MTSLFRMIPHAKQEATTVAADITEKDDKLDRAAKEGIKRSLTK